MKKILFASSEAVPYIKTGGLADVVGALPKYFDHTKYDVRVILPKYMCIDESLKKHMKYRTHFYVNLGWRSQYAGVFEATYDQITYYFIDSEYYFAGDRPYHHLHEDLEKFAFFDKAVLIAMKVLGFQADIVHCNDWQTALIPAYLKEIYQQDPFYQRMKTVFTIHNIRFQGRWILNAIQDITGLPERCFTPDRLEIYGEGNYLKGGIAYADKITTVSENYAKEICSVEGGEGMEGILRARGADVVGIVNGIDHQLFNPEHNRFLVRNYDASDLIAGKRANKVALQETLGLPKKNDTFLIAMVSRLADQKGFDLLMPVMDELLQDQRIQLVVLGSGEQKYVDYLRGLEWRHPDQVRVDFQYREERANQIYASSDAFLMPSMFEPCGLSQMISMRYGTVPIVRETGGLKDTVLPYNEYEQTGTGFGFCNYNAHEMLFTIQYAYRVYFQHRKEWNALAKRCMELDLSWESSAAKYALLYEELMAQ